MGMLAAWRRRAWERRNHWPRYPGQVQKIEDWCAEYVADTANHWKHLDALAGINEVARLASQRFGIPLIRGRAHPDIRNAAFRAMRRILEPHA